MYLIDIVDWTSYLGRPDIKTPKWVALASNFFEDSKYFDLQDYDRYVLLYLLTERCKSNGPFEIRPHRAAHYIGLGCTTAHIGESIGRLAKEKLITLSPIDYTSEQIRTEAYGSVRARENPCLQDKTRQDKTEKTSSCPDKHPDPTTISEVSLPGTAAREEAKPSDPKASSLLALWNELCGTALPQVSRMTSKRAKQIATRLQEEPDLAYWEECIKRLARSPLATGQIKSEKYPKGWKADFDWLVKNDTHHVKISEGRYDDKSATTSKPEWMKTPLWNGKVGA